MTVRLQRFARTLVAIATVLAVSGSAKAQDAAPATSAAPAPIVRPGDSFRITVWKAPEMSGEFPVGVDGKIVHPLYREIQVSGESFPVAEERIRSYLGRYQADPQVAIELLVRVTIGGQVTRPSLLSVPAQSTVAEVIALSGGPTDRADLEHVHLVRGTQEQVGDLRLGAVGLAQERIQSGDQIFVPRRSAIFSEYILPGVALLAPVLTLVGFFIRH